MFLNVAIYASGVFRKRHNSCRYKV